MPTFPTRGLYLLTPDTADTPRLLAETRQALEAGIVWLQHRNKCLDATQREAQARTLLTLCRNHAVPLIINDDMHLAAHIGADGVHLGQGDGEISAARALLGPEAIIGASCYDDITLAQRAMAAGASYVAFGAFFPSPSKPATRRATPALLRDAAALPLPKVAIGGITPDNGGLLTAAGADLLAVISSVYAAPDIGAAVRSYHSCFRT